VSKGGKTNNLTTQSGRNLKNTNYALIWAYGVAHLAVGYSVLFDVVPSINDMKEIWSLVGGAAVGSVFAVLVTEAVGRDAKAQLVHFSRRSALPGRRAFTVYVHEDPRIVRLNERHGPFPSNADEQNALWYSFLQKNGTAEPVLHAHGLYLLTRDLTWVALLLWLVACIVAMRTPAALPPKLLFLAFLAIEFALIRHIAAHASIDLVKTVLAVESTRDGPP
jgi:hypothetical protein